MPPCKTAGRLRRVVLAFAPLLVALSIAALAQDTRTKSTAGEACRHSPPVQAVSGIEWYADKSFSVVDEAKRKQHLEMQKPLREFQETVSAAVDASVVSGKPSPGLQCALANLEKWARSGALLTSPKTTSPLAEQTIAIVGLNFVVIKFRSISVPLSPEIEQWLKSATRVLVAIYQGNKLRQNLYVWSGVAAASNELLFPDPLMRRYHDQVWQAAIGQIRPDGYVPAELSRAGRALVYHNYFRSALTALWMVRQRLGIPVSPSDHAALQRLSAVINANVCDPSAIEALAGAKQEPLDRWNLSMGEHFSDPLLDDKWRRCASVPTDGTHAAAECRLATPSVRQFRSWGLSRKHSRAKRRGPMTCSAIRSGLFPARTRWAAHRRARQGSIRDSWRGRSAWSSDGAYAGRLGLIPFSSARRVRLGSR